MSNSVNHIEVHFEEGEVVSFNFGPYGWNQWGAGTATLGESMRIVEALDTASFEDEELRDLLYGEDV